MTQTVDTSRVLMELHDKHKQLVSLVHTLPHSSAFRRQLTGAVESLMMASTTVAIMEGAIIALTEANEQLRAKVSAMLEVKAVPTYSKLDSPAVQAALGVAISFIEENTGHPHLAERAALEVLRELVK